MFSRDTLNGSFKAPAAISLDPLAVLESSRLWVVRCTSYFARSSPMFAFRNDTGMRLTRISIRARKP